MTFENLKERVARAIDRNDLWDALKLTAKWDGADQSYMNYIERWEAEHIRDGHLTSRVKCERDQIIRDIRHDLGEEAFIELRI
jgi:hypothetical protein